MNLSEKFPKLNFVSLTGAKKKKATEEIRISYDIFFTAKYPFSIGVPNAKLVQFNMLYKGKQIKSCPGLT